MRPRLGKWLRHEYDIVLKSDDDIRMKIGQSTWLRHKYELSLKEKVTSNGIETWTKFKT